MNKLELIKLVREKTLEKIISKYGSECRDLTEMKLSVWNVREILYEETKKIAQDIFEEDFR